ncbi:hypothetical protein PSPO01_09782 [Paraphaeosphaeria sporulosa]
MPKSGGRRSATLHEWGTPLTRNARHVLILKVQSDIINTSISWFTSDDIADKITDDEPQSAELQILPHRSTTPVSSESTSAATANRDSNNVGPKKRGAVSPPCKQQEAAVTFPAKAWFPCVNLVPTSSCPLAVPTTHRRIPTPGSHTRVNQNKEPSDIRCRQLQHPCRPRPQHSTLTS